MCIAVCSVSLSSCSRIWDCVWVSFHKFSITISGLNTRETDYQCSGSTSPDESCSPKKKLRYKQTSPQVASLANKTHKSVSVSRLQIVFWAKLLYCFLRLQCVVPHQHTDKREVTVCDGIRPELAVGLAVLILPGDFGQQRKNQEEKTKETKAGWKKHVGKRQTKKRKNN